MEKLLLAVALHVTLVAGQHGYPDPSHQDIVQPLIDQLSLSNIQNTLTHFADGQAWANRHYNSQTGRDSQLWLMAQAEEMVEASGRTDIEVYEYEHSWLQNSVVARIDGTDQTARNESGIVILGAHQDSTANSPGAGDDGSGSMTILEIFRVLVEDGFRPERDIEFHWYAAEESGLLGSRAMARDYSERNVPVYGMINVDMDSYSESTGLHVVDNGNTDSSATQYMIKVIEEYGAVDIATVGGNPPGNTDSRSWVEVGYQACFAIEYPKSPFSHTPLDNLDSVSFDYIHRFSFHVLAFAVELSFS